MARFLVTGVGGPAGLSLAQQLRDRGHWVLGVDMQDVDPSIADVVARVSRADAPQYLWELRGLVASLSVDTVIPTVSDELVLFSQARDELAPGVGVVIGHPAPVHVANDKFLTMTCLDSAGVGVPDFALPGSFGSAVEAMDFLGGPIVVKPRISRGGRGVRVLEKLRDRGRHAARVWSTIDDSWIVQRFAPGTEFAPVVHRAEGGTAVVVVLEKTELKEGRVGNAVSVRRADCPANADVAQLARDAVDALGLVGPVDLDIRRMPDGTPVVLEINARFGANSAHAPELLDSVLAAHVSGTPSGLAG